MSYRLRGQIASRILDSIKSTGYKVTYPEDKLSRLLVVNNATRNFDTKTAQFSLRENLLKRALNLNEIPKVDNACSEKGNIQYRVGCGEFISSIVGDVIKDGETYAHGLNVHRYIRTKLDPEYRSKSQCVLVDFGSPNVAKPLHAGHLRSTIIGQFVANINETLGNRVIRVNYLGDWGTQFGLLAVGFGRFGSDEKLEKDGLNHLLQVYIKVNEIVEIEGFGGETYRKALDYMVKLEENDSTALALWKKFRDLSLESGLNTFDKLGIKYDATEFESDFVELSKELCKNLHRNGFLRYSDENIGLVEKDKFRIILQKSDGTSLYLSRDLAAILNRIKTYNFDRIHYVVDSGQSAHFQKMKKILEILDIPIHNQDNLHVAFGRVRGMSTRKGQLVQLSDILDEAKSRMLEIMREKSTTKAKDLDHVAMNLGLSAVFIQDLKEKRQKDYDFDWERMLSNKGATGVFLQYAHARLCTLEESFAELMIFEKIDFSILVENEAIRLAQHLARYDQVLNEVYYTLEPHLLVHYLLDLANLSNGALAKLNVKGSTQNVATARLSLFHAARLVLTNGIRILGLKPLNEV